MSCLSKFGHFCSETTMMWHWLLLEESHMSSSTYISQALVWSTHESPSFSAAKEHRWNWFLSRAMLLTFSSLETLDWQFRAKYILAGYREWLRCNKQVCPITTSKKPCWLFSVSSRSRWGTSLNFNLFPSSCPVAYWHNWLKESRASLCSEIIIGGSSFSRKMLSGTAGRVLA